MEHTSDENEMAPKGETCELRGRHSKWQDLPPVYQVFSPSPNPLRSSQPLSVMALLLGASK